MTGLFHTFFELFINLYQGTVFVLFCYFFLDGKFSKTKNRIFAAATIALMFIGVTVQNYLVPMFEFSELILYCAIMFTYTFVCLKGKIYLKILAPVIAYSVMAGIALALECLCMVIFNVQWEHIMSDNGYVRYFMSIAINLIMTIVLYMIARFQKNKMNLRSSSDIITFIVIPLSGLAIIILTFFVSTNSSLNRTQLLMLAIIAVLTFLINLVVLNTITKLSKSYELKAQNLMMQREAELYRQEIDSTNEYINQIASIKHDVKNKLLCVETLIESGEYDKAKGICCDETESLSSVRVFNTENVFLNSVLNVVQKKSTEASVDFKTELNSDLKMIDGEDIITLVGNLCDNALEYLRDKEKREIFLRLEEKGAYYIITVKNSLTGSVLKNNPELSTSKENKIFHGKGISHIKSISKKYDGFADFSEDANYFISKIMLKKSSIT